MLNKKTLSVIIPVYKRISVAKRAVKSVLQQTGLGDISLEIIICDDEKDAKISKINKKTFTSMDTRVRYYRNRFNEGPGGNRQTGLYLSNGKYISFLDSDDVLKPEFVKKMIGMLDKEINLSATYCFSNLVYGKGFGISSLIKLRLLNLIKNICLRCSLYFNNGYLFPGAFYLMQISHVMFRKSKIKDFRFKYEYRHGGEDWDIFLHALNKGVVKIVPEHLLIFNYSITSSTLQRDNLRKKWKSYSLLASRLPGKFKNSVFYILFLMYISLFRGVYEK